MNQQAEPEIEALGDCLDYCANKALEAFAVNEPALAAEIRAEINARTAQTATLVLAGGNKPATVSVVAIRPDGTRQPLASMSVALMRYN